MAEASGDDKGVGLSAMKLILAFSVGEPVADVSSE
jgi:hypothetical protein